MTTPRALILALLIAMWAAALAVYPGMPDRIPVHIDLAGNPDRWSDKSLATWLLIPIVATGIALLMGWLSVLARRRPDLVNYPGKERVLALPVERRGPVLAHLQAMVDWIAASTIATLALVQWALSAVATGGRAGGLLAMTFVVGLIGPLAAIVVQSARINRAVDAIRKAGGARGR